jgi:hypothetical protein
MEKTIAQQQAGHERDLSGSQHPEGSVVKNNVTMKCFVGDRFSTGSGNDFHRSILGSN